jgi:hypothetical protein
MSRQIAVRLSDDIVDIVDQLVSDGKGQQPGSRRRRSRSGPFHGVRRSHASRPRLAYPIHTAHLDKVRPVLILTRELVRPHLSRVTVAPITTTARGLSTEVPVGPPNGLDHSCVISCEPSHVAHPPW